MVTKTPQKRPNRNSDMKSFGAAKRFIRTTGRIVAEKDPADLLRLRELQDELDAAWVDAIQGLRDQHFNDRQIGDALGVTPQAVRSRWPSPERRIDGAGARWKER